MPFSETLFLGLVIGAFAIFGLTLAGVSIFTALKR
jgi:hypothetical protein